MSPETSCLGSKDVCARQSKSRGSVTPTARWENSSYCLLMACSGLCPQPYPSKWW